MRKLIPIVAAGAALAVTGAGIGYASLSKDVTLSVDGQARTVTTRAGSVGELLAAEGITTSGRDVVAPAATSALDEGTRVAVQFARPVSFEVDGQPRTVWTTATTVEQALAALGTDTQGAALSSSRSTPIGRQGLALEVNTLKTVTVDAAGKEKTVRTTGTTVADALAAAGVTADRDDRLSAEPTAALADGDEITWTRIDVRTVREKRAVDYDTVRKADSSLDRGTTKVDVAGKDGTRTLTFREVRTNGKLTKRTQTDSTVTTKARDRVLLVGTRAPKVASASSSGGGGGGVWDRLAQCESGGNWSINTGNGFYGGLQFTLSTWRAYGGSGMPHQASRSAQIAVAERVQAGQGWGAWPACTAKLGIR